MPVAGDGARFDNRRWRPHTDQNDRCRHHRNRRRRVHCDAQRAMVGIALQGMHVRHLDQDQKHQQGQAKNSGRPESAWLPAAKPAKICLQPYQQIIPSF